MKKLIIIIYFLLPVYAFPQTLDVDTQLNYCVSKVSRTLTKLKVYNQQPRTIDKNGKNWTCVPIEDWTSGFWSGILWYSYEVSQKEDLKTKADSFTRSLTPIAYRKADDHDLGFMMFCSFGNGYKYIPNYKAIILSTADSLATLYNPKVGTILSWPRMNKSMNWQHNTIMDNMINLEMLFWASKNGGGKKLYDIALSHAQKTMNNHFRNDYSSYHVMLYDTVTGKKVKGVTHQGYADNSMWARGQAWAIYGFTMCYRETHNPEFLDFVQKVSDIFIERLPKDDVIPYWDFDAPDIPNAPKDASAAAVTASALLELSELLKPTDPKKSNYYKQWAIKMLEVLASPKYQSGTKNDAFLLHSTGHKPAGKEIDASIIYADYYYLEALLRLKKIQEGKSIYMAL